MVFSFYVFHTAPGILFGGVVGLQPLYPDWRKQKAKKINDYMKKEKLIRTPCVRAQIPVTRTRLSHVL